jgi:hypothetical protein
LPLGIDVQIASGRILAVDAVYATMALDEGDTAAILYWARGVPGYGPPLTILDWSVEKMLPRTFEVAEDRLSELSQDRRSRHGSLGTFAEMKWVVSVEQRRGLRVMPVPDHLTKPEAWTQLWRQAAIYYRAGDVAISRLADERKYRDVLNPWDYRGGPRPDDKPAVIAWMYGVVLGLDEASADPVDPPKAKPTQGQR